jgi:hypothetical protein
MLRLHFFPFGTGRCSFSDKFWEAKYGTELYEHRIIIIETDKLLSISTSSFPLSVSNRQ